MARKEVPKEDLVRDATAFAVRVEFRRTRNHSGWIFVGLRSDGGGSVYFGDDEFYAFNDRGELRRAFRDGRLLKAEGGCLTEMRRERSGEASVLATRTLPPEEQDDLLQSVEVLIQGAAKGVECGWFLFARSSGDTVGDVNGAREWLGRLGARPIVVAQRPHAAG